MSVGNKKTLPTRLLPGIPSFAAVTDVTRPRWRGVVGWPSGHPIKQREVGLIGLWVFSVGAAHGREGLRAMGEAQDRGHGPLLHFNQLNPPPSSESPDPSKRPEGRPTAMRRVTSDRNSGGFAGQFQPPFDAGESVFNAIHAEIQGRRLEWLQEPQHNVRHWGMLGFVPHLNLRSYGSVRLLLKYVPQSKQEAAQGRKKIHCQSPGVAFAQGPFKPSSR